METPSRWYTDPAVHTALQRLLAALVALAMALLGHSVSMRSSGRSASSQ